MGRLCRNLRFSQRSWWRVKSSEMLCRVDWYIQVFVDVSAALRSPTSVNYRSIGLTSQKTWFLISDNWNGTCKRTLDISRYFLERLVEGVGWGGTMGILGTRCEAGSFHTRNRGTNRTMMKVMWNKYFPKWVQWFEILIKSPVHSAITNVSLLRPDSICKRSLFFPQWTATTPCTVLKGWSS